MRPGSVTFMRQSYKNFTDGRRKKSGRRYYSRDYPNYANPEGWLTACLQGAIHLRSRPPPMAQG